MPVVRVARLALLLPLVLGCGSTEPARPTATPTLTASAPALTPTPVPTGTFEPTTTPGPSATPLDALAFPTTSGVELQPGRYSSRPPFDVPFTFEIPEPGWGSAHINGEFFDVIQPATLGVEPERWVAFALPVTLYGGRVVSAAGLTPAQAAATFAGHSGLIVGEPLPYRIDGLTGVIVDIATNQTGIDLFGGPEGDLLLDPAYDVRMVVLPHEEALLLILVMAPEGELESAWYESRPIVDSVDL